jgi:hypothetical protein
MKSDREFFYGLLEQGLGRTQALAALAIWRDMQSPSVSEFRSLLHQRRWVRGEVRRRSIAMKLHHEARRLLRLGVERSKLDELVERIDDRPRCPKCGRKVG